MNDTASTTERAPSAEVDDQEAFDRAYAEETPSATPPAKSSEPAKKDESPHAPSADDPKKDGADDPEPTQTALEKLAERASKRGDPQSTKVETQPKKDEPPSKVDAPAPAARPTARTIKALDEILKDDRLKDRKFTIDGEDVPASELLERYPEATAIAAIMVELMGGAAPAGPDAELMKQIGELRQSHDTVAAKLAFNEFWGGVSEIHEDGYDIAASPEFKDWLKTQSPGIQAMANGTDVEDAVSILDAYKESVLKIAARDVYVKKAKAKKDRDDLHAETLRGKPGAPKERKPVGELSEEEQQRQFDEQFEKE